MIPYIVIPPGYKLNTEAMDDDRVDKIMAGDPARSQAHVELVLNFCTAACSRDDDTRVMDRRFIDKTDPRQLKAKSKNGARMFTETAQAYWTPFEIRNTTLARDDPGGAIFTMHLPMIVKPYGGLLQSLWLALRPAADYPAAAAAIAKAIRRCERDADHPADFHLPLPKPLLQRNLRDPHYSEDRRQFRLRDWSTKSYESKFRLKAGPPPKPLGDFPVPLPKPLDEFL